MDKQFSRTEIIFGSAGMEKLFAARVAVFGIGGVGGYAVEALARSGIGQLDLFDNDRICASNINRQIYATRKTLGMYKVDVARARITEINPSIIVNTYRMFFLPSTSKEVDFTSYDYIIDAIDTVSGKIELAVKGAEHDIPVISSMGAGNKVNAADFQVADIYDTDICPLAKVMRRELRKRGIQKLKVVYSREPVTMPQADTTADFDDNCANLQENPQSSTRQRQIPGSNAFVPAVAGMIIAGEVVKYLAGFDTSAK